MKYIKPLQLCTTISQPFSWMNKCYITIINWLLPFDENINYRQYKYQTNDYVNTFAHHFTQLYAPANYDADFEYTMKSYSKIK